MVDMRLWVCQNLTKSRLLQVYDMQFELNEIEARREQYPSTISFLNLLNVLIAEERDTSDGGRRYWPFDCSIFS